MIKENTGLEELRKLIFETNTINFEENALSVFHAQYKNNPLYHEYCQSIHKNEKKINSLDNIPFLPISFFKNHEVKTGIFTPSIIFESSGTSGQTPSRHFVKDPALYEESFLRSFHSNFGDTNKWCILALLPSYLERKNSSLVYMVEKLITDSGNANSGFYLDNKEALNKRIIENESNNIQTLLIGVTYALIDFAIEYPMQLKYTTVMETGGMKGRKEEMNRNDVHSILKSRLGIQYIHSEYGMTELFSQAYSKKDGIFYCPQWMRIGIRERDDPFAVRFKTNENGNSLSGAINIIDLANLDSCAFIGTDDRGILHTDGSFEVTGRMDNSDARGCSLMTT